MGMFDQFPYTNFHELNLDWILKSLDAIENTMNQFVAINTLKYADPIQWNITTQYEKNTIVIEPNTGTAYISVQPVPAGVSIANTDYWTVVFNLSEFIVKMAQNFCAIYEPETTLTATVPSNYNDWLIWNDTLYRNINPGGIIAGDTYIVDGNIERFTVEDVVGHIENLNTTDKSNLVNAINDVLQTLGNICGNLTDLNTTDKSNLVNAINEVLQTINDAVQTLSDALADTCGNLDNLNTTDKSNLVNAINEVLQTIVNTCGILADLNTTDKSNLVNAINEIFDKLVVVENVTFNVPADFADANAVLAYLEDKIVGENVVIKYADGTYYGNQLALKYKDYHGVTIEGNKANPLACTINLGVDNVVAFMCHYGNIGKIDGFNIIGTARTEVGGVVSWGTTINQLGYFIFNGRMRIGKHNVVDGVYYGIGAQKDSQVYVEYGDAITETDANNIIANYTTWIGKGFIVNNSGDVGLHAYENSYLEAVNSVSLNAADDDRSLGFGYYSESASTMDLRGVVAGGCHKSGVQSSGGSDIVGWNLYSIGNRCGAQSSDNGAIQLYDAILDSNGVGAQARTNGSISSGGCDAKNNTYDGYSALSGGVFNMTRTAYANNNGHAGLYWDDKSTIREISNLTGSGNAWGLTVSAFNNFLDVPPVSDHSEAGYYIFRKNPSSFFGYFCRNAGSPGKWAPFGLSLMNDVSNLDLNDAPMGLISVDQGANSTMTNLPYTGNHNYIIITFGFFTGDSRMQIAFCDDGHICLRNRWANVWQPWMEGGSPV